MIRRRTTFLERQEARRIAHATREERKLASWVAEMDAMPVRDGLCYFLAGTVGPIKIGHSKDLHRRMAEIALIVGYPVTLLATANGSYFREAHYHKRFAAHRLHGEWFDRHPDILAEIARLSRAQRQEQAA